MKKIFTILLGLFLCANIFAQEGEVEEFKPHGAPIVKVFTAVSYDLNKDAVQKSRFDIERVYLGYKYAFSKNISSKVIFDVGDPNDGGGFQYSAFVKNAILDWQMHPKLKLSLGMIGFTQMDVQDKVWGYRYIYKSFQDFAGMGPSTEVGANMEVGLHEKVKLNIFAVNGDGFKVRQDEFGTYRFGASIDANPIEGLTLKAFYSIMQNKFARVNDTTVYEYPTPINNSNIAALVAYEMKDVFRIGAEYNIMKNAKKFNTASDGYDLSGISVYATYILSKKLELFARFDQLTSNKISGSDVKWNESKNGNLVLGGLQYSPVKGVKAALNYRTYMYEKTGKDPLSMIYLNFEYAF